VIPSSCRLWLVALGGVLSIVVAAAVGVHVAIARATWFSSSLDEPPVHDTRLLLSAPDRQLANNDQVPSGSRPLVGFVLRNRTGRDIYIQKTGLSSASFWAVLREGRPIRAEHDCAVCVCQTPCAVCGRSAAAVERIPAGSAYSWGWTGNEWMADSGDTDRCERSRAIEKGRLTVVVVFGRSWRVERSLGASDALVDEPMSVATDFEFPPNGQVEIVAR
jgi:hypothetical protein